MKDSGTTPLFYDSSGNINSPKNGKNKNEKGRQSPNDEIQVIHSDPSQIMVKVHEEVVEEKPQQDLNALDNTQHLDDLKQYFTYLQSEQQSEQSEYLPDLQTGGNTGQNSHEANVKLDTDLIE